MAAHRRIHGRTSEDGSRGATLWVEIAIEVESDHRCPLTQVTDRAASGSVQLVGDTCHVTLGAHDETGDEVHTYTTEVAAECVCPSFCRDGCVPDVLAVENGSLTIGAYADSRATLATAMEAVRERAAQVHLKRLTTAAPPTEDQSWRTAAMDSVSLTDKQREAVQAAVEMGYYDSPRDASLGDLADRLGVSRSALSQRLTAVETKLITELVSRL
jgi:hypothetical protein